MPKEIYQLRISIEGSQSPFFRRILVSSKMDFIRLHESIQVIMNWSDDKLFLFQNGPMIITDTIEWEEDKYPDALDAFETLLSDILEKGLKLRYQYLDKNSEWNLLIEVEAELEENPELNYPNCIEAVGGQLPEDCKNLEDYYRILAIYNNPEHEEHVEVKEWLGDSFNPDEVDLSDMNKELYVGEEYVSTLDLLETVEDAELNFLEFDELLEIPHVASNELQLEAARKQFEQYKIMGEKAILQVPDEGLFWQFNEDSNSIAIIVKHLWGNMLSRWTDFLIADGEKEWRERDSEFEIEFKTRYEMMDKWELGWACLFEALDELNGADWDKTVYIRKQPHLVWQAINRQLTHYAYHIGQIVFLAKMLTQRWDSLSIPKGKSKEFNEQMNQK